MTTTNEIWKPTNNPKYQISNFGRIRKELKQKGKFSYLKGSKSKWSYCYLDSRCTGGSHVYIHKFVAENFIGEIPEGYVVHHIDEDIHNNHVDNLKILSRQEHRTIHKGSGKPKLSKEQVRAIRGQYYLAGLSRADVARNFPRVSPSSINHIINCIDGYYEDFDDPIFDAVYYADKPHIVNTYDGGRIQKWRHPNK